MANHHAAVLPLALDFGPDPGPAGAMYTELLLPEVSQGPGRGLQRTGRPEGPRRGAPRRPGRRLLRTQRPHRHGPADGGRRSAD